MCKNEYTLLVRRRILSLSSDNTCKPFFRIEQAMMAGNNSKAAAFVMGSIKLNLFMIRWVFTSFVAML